MVYSSINNPKIKEIKKLYNKKYRDELGKFIVEGEHLLHEAHKAGVLECIILIDDSNIDIDVEKLYVTQNVMKGISNLNTPSQYLGICNKITDTEIGNKVMILDNIQDPGNLGTIIRSCVAFNFDTLIISNDSVDVYNPKVLRATQGMIFKLSIIVCNIKEKISELKEANYSIIGTDVNTGKDIKEFVKLDKFAIIMGNEGNGLSSDIKRLCDSNIYIKMNNDCESLNVGVAASIIMYELNKE